MDSEEVAVKQRLILRADIWGQSSTAASGSQPAAGEGPAEQQHDESISNAASGLLAKLQKDQPMSDAAKEFFKDEEAPLLIHEELVNGKFVIRCLRSKLELFGNDKDCEIQLNPGLADKRKELQGIRHSRSQYKVYW